MSRKQTSLISPNGAHPFRPLANPFLLIFIISYGAAFVGFVLAAPPGDWVTTVWLAIGVLAICAFILVLSRGWSPKVLDIVRPRAELWMALIWLGLIFLLDWFTRSRGFELVNAFSNWMFLVFIPFGLLLMVRGQGLALRATARSVGFTRSGLGKALKLVIVAMLLFTPVLYVVGRQQREAIQLIMDDPIREGVAFLGGFLLALLTVAFVEEFFFRGLLQSRLTRYLGSELRGLLVVSLLFGLMHLPYLFFSEFEPSQGNLVWALSSTIVEIAMVAVLFGVLWAKTHNLIALMVAHAYIDAFVFMTTFTVQIGTG